MNEKMLKFRTKVVLFIALIFSLTILAAAFHHHDPGDDDSDCPICFAIANFTAISAVAVIFTFVLSRISLEPPVIIPFHSIQKHYSRSRAPPVSI